MTALTTPARSRIDASPRPVPWRRMVWVTWRQHRFALTGAFAGAPVLAREMETGTFRYAWTQGFGRWRSALAKIMLLAVTVAVAAGSFSALISWYYQPYFAVGNQNPGISMATPFASGLFDLRGVGLAAWTLAAFAIGALAGMLIRRAVPAMVATLVAYTGLAIAAGSFLRQHYMTPLLTSSPNVPGTAWIMSQWWTRDGRFAFTGLPPMSIVQQYCTPGPQGSTAVKTPVTITRCLSQHGYAQWTS